MNSKFFCFDSHLEDFPSIVWTVQIANDFPRAASIVLEWRNIKCRDIKLFCSLSKGLDEYWILLAKIKWLQTIPRVFADFQNSLYLLVWRVFITIQFFDIIRTSRNHAWIYRGGGSKTSGGTVTDMNIIIRPEAKPIIAIVFISFWGSNFALYCFLSHTNHFGLLGLDSRTWRKILWGNIVRKITRKMAYFSFKVFFQFISRNPPSDNFGQ